MIDVHTHMHNTVTQALQFMLDVQDDEEWLVAETTDDEDITRYICCKVEGEGRKPCD